MKKLHDNETPAPVLADFPSAKASDGVLTGTARPVRKKTRSFFHVVARLFAVVAVLVAIAGGGLFAFLQSGPISSDQFRAQAENRLTTMLGPDRSVKLDAAVLSMGDNGMAALRVQNLRILENENINLGVAREASLTMKLMPLMTGNVVLDRVSVKGATVSLAPIFTELKTQREIEQLHPAEALGAFDLRKQLRALGQTLKSLDAQLKNTGLDRFELVDAKLLGFEMFDLSSSRARIVSMSVERDKNFQTGLFLTALVETDRSNWPIDVVWREVDGGGHRLEARFGGLDMHELLHGAKTYDVAFESTVDAQLVLPFSADGEPLDGTLVTKLGGGALRVGPDLATSLQPTDLAFQVLPEKNQLDLAPSQLMFSHMKASAFGGLRFAQTGPKDKTSRTRFEFLLNDVVANGMPKAGEPRQGAIKIGGHLKDDAVALDTLLLKTASGDMSGKATIDTDGEDRKLNLRLDIASMDVADFKQFWPAFLAPGLRAWAVDGIKGGTLSDANVVGNARLTEVLGKARFRDDEMASELRLTDTSVKLPGDLPPISNASGTISYAGVTSRVRLSSGRVSLGKTGRLSVAKAKLDIGDYNLPIIPADLEMEIVGPAKALYALGTKKPLAFSKSTKLDPAAIKGSSRSTISARLGIGKTVDLMDNRWAADVSLKDFAARLTDGSRRVTRGSLLVKARPGKTTIDGKAYVDGVPADLAMVQQGDGGAINQSATLVLDEKARKKMGIDLSPILKGKIAVLVTSAPGGASELNVDLRDARLEFPWIGWSKGKKIPATVSMLVRQKGKRVSISKLRLRGKGFRADGELVIEGRNLKSGKFRNVRLNNTDDLDVDVRAIPDGFNIGFSGRSYDGRALILDLNKATSSGSGGKDAGRIAIKGRVDRLIGFGGQILKDVSVNMVQRGGRITSAYVSAMAAGNAPTSFELKPLPGGMQTLMQTSNAGAILSFLNLYSNVRGGELSAVLVRDSSRVFRGTINARNFDLLNEPRIGVLLRKPSPNLASVDREDVERAYARLPKIDPNRVHVDSAAAKIEKGPDFLKVRKGRVAGGDASAVFEGRVYDTRGRIRMTGTFLPGRGLNRVVSKIPVLGFAFGGKRNQGFLGVTFKVSGPYGNPKIRVNPLSLIAPGVFRKIFEF